MGHSVTKKHEIPILLITENVYVGLIELKVCWIVRKYVQQTFRRDSCLRKVERIFVGRFMHRKLISNENMNLKQNSVALN